MGIKRKWKNKKKKWYVPRKLVHAPKDRLPGTKEDFFFSLSFYHLDGTDLFPLADWRERLCWLGSSSDLRLPLVAARIWQTVITAKDNSLMFFKRLVLRARLFQLAQEDIPYYGIVVKPQNKDILSFLFIFDSFDNIDRQKKVTS